MRLGKTGFFIYPRADQKDQTLVPGTLWFLVHLFFLLVNWFFWQKKRRRIYVLSFAYIYHLLFIIFRKKYSKFLYIEYFEPYLASDTRKSYPKNALPIPQQVTVDTSAVIWHELGGPARLGPGAPAGGAWCQGGTDTQAGPSVPSKPRHHPSYTMLSSDTKPNSC